MYGKDNFDAFYWEVLLNSMCLQFCSSQKQFKEIFLETIGLENSNAPLELIWTPCVWAEKKWNAIQKQKQLEIILGLVHTLQDELFHWQINLCTWFKFQKLIWPDQNYISYLLDYSLAHLVQDLQSWFCCYIFFKNTKKNDIGIL